MRQLDWLWPAFEPSGGASNAMRVWRSSNMLLLLLGRRVQPTMVMVMVAEMERRRVSYLDATTNARAAARVPVSVSVYPGTSYSPIRPLSRRAWAIVVT